MSDNFSSTGQVGPMRWTIEDSEDFVAVRTEGSFNLADHVAMVRDVIGQPYWKPGRDAFFDHRTLAFDGVGYEIMRGAVDNHLAFDAEIGAGRAAVLMGNAAHYGLGRIFDSVANERISARIRIFTDEAAARVWLAGEEDL